jgi:hypothetical protein
MFRILNASYPLPPPLARIIVARPTLTELIRRVRRALIGNERHHYSN